MSKESATPGNCPKIPDGKHRPWSQPTAWPQFSPALFAAALQNNGHEVKFGVLDLKVKLPIYHEYNWYSIQREAVNRKKPNERKEAT
jgi:hypothetical protein